jgi:hypothetical protein
MVLNINKERFYAGGQEQALNKLSHQVGVRNV